MAKTEVHVLRFNEDVGTRVAALIREAKTRDRDTIYRWKIGSYAFNLIVTYRGPGRFNFTLSSITRSNIVQGNAHTRKKCVAVAYGASLGLTGKLRATG